MHCNNINIHDAFVMLRTPKINTRARVTQGRTSFLKNAIELNLTKNSEVLFGRAYSHKTVPTSRKYHAL